MSHLNTASSEAAKASAPLSVFPSFYPEKLCMGLQVSPRLQWHQVIEYNGEISVHCGPGGRPPGPQTDRTIPVEINTLSSVEVGSHFEAPSPHSAWTAAGAGSG